jgi:site-specific DNA-cytosine methylase
MFGDLVSDIPQPKDKGILLKDIIESGEVDKDKAYAILESQSRHEVSQESIRKRIEGGFRTVVREVIQLNESKESGGKQPYQQNRTYDINGIYPAICTCNNGLIQSETFLRKLTQTELERLQGFPDGWTSILYYNQAASVLGDGWTLPVIEHILKQIKS